MGLINLIFPTFCLICKKDAEYICGNCFLEMFPVMENLCPVCDQPAYRYFYHLECKERINFDGMYFLLRYNDKFHDVIEMVKYKYYFGVCHFLGRLLAMNFKLNVKIAPDSYIVTSVPVHSSKMRSRGFNQAELIGKAFAKEMGLGYQELLVRVRKTQTQVGMDRQQRVANLKDSFKFAHETIPQNVILIDDIFTTGTTIKECTETLKKAGVQSVFVAVLAKATR